MAQTSTPAAAAPCTVGENSCWATARGVTQSRGVPPHQSPWGGWEVERFQRDPCHVHSPSPPHAGVMSLLLDTEGNAGWTGSTHPPMLTELTRYGRHYRVLLML